MCNAAAPSICHNSICLNLASSRRHLGTTTHFVPGHGMRRDGRGRRARRLSCRRIWRRSKSLSAIGSFARLSSARPTSWPSTVSICGTSIPQMKRKGWQSALVIAHFHRHRRCRRRRCRSELIRVGGGERNKRIRRTLILNFRLKMGNFFN